MPSVKQLVTRSVELLRKQPILWIPPLALALFSGLIGPAGRDAGAVLLIVSALISLAVTAGWVSLIARSERGLSLSLDDFFIAIGRTFTRLMIGVVALGAVMAAGVVPVILATMAWMGTPALERLGNTVKAISAKPDATFDNLATMDPSLLAALWQLLIGVSVAVLWVAVVATVLLLWQQGVVLANLGWRAAWAQSARLVKAHFGLLMQLLTLQGVALLAAAIASALPVPFGAIGWLAMMGVNTVTTVSFTLLYLQLVPEATTVFPSSDEPTATAS